MNKEGITSKQKVKDAVCHQHGHQITSFNGDKQLSCRLCGSTLEEIREEKI
jgi:hypothetical protein